MAGFMSSGIPTAHDKNDERRQLAERKLKAILNRRVTNTQGPENAVYVLHIRLQGTAAHGSLPVLLNRVCLSLCLRYFPLLSINVYIARWKG
jgi:hypothetical protein